MIQIRPERSEDVETIHALTVAAFKPMAYSSQTEAKIVDCLRAAGALTLSLVAVQDEALVGHVAFSPVTINGCEGDWYGLGPVSVWPERQRQGIGQALIRDGLQRLKVLPASGCVLLGNPNYYGRFGFEQDPDLIYRGAPARYFQRLTLSGSSPKGEVRYHPSFEIF
ncbi:MAG: hypothetical protein RLZZ141_1937 [Pseudomonadota bacterium]